MRIRVAVYGGQCGSEYSLRHVSGYSIWEVRVNDIGERTSVKLLADNVEKPNLKSLNDRDWAHSKNLI